MFGVTELFRLVAVEKYFRSYPCLPSHHYGIAELPCEQLGVSSSILLTN